MMLQLNPPIPLHTPKGEGIAWLITDYGMEHNLMWTVAIDATGEIWTFSNSEVRAQKNISLGRIVDNKQIIRELESKSLQKMESVSNS